jgi:hypothetical protein
MIGANYDGSIATPAHRSQGEYCRREGSMCARVLVSLERLEQYKDPIFQDPRSVWLELALGIHELEAALWIMKKAWWP